MIGMQVHYGNPLLDTIHTYFPAFLYEPELFQTVPELLGYARLQMQRHFDLFAAGRAAYRPLRPQANFVQTTLDILSLITPQNVTVMAPRSTHQNTLQFSDPVIVRPTAAQIATATSIEHVTNDEEACAICQDTISAGTDVTVINFCEHSFHTACISTWFQQNVRCPVCRHDIRDGL